MSFYFQPPVFAVRPVLQVATAIPAYTTVPSYTAMSVPVAVPVYTTPLVYPMLPASVSSQEAAPPKDPDSPSSRPRLLRMAFYGHGASDDAQDATCLWLETSLADKRTLVALATAMPRLAITAGVPATVASVWSTAQVYIMYPGSEPITVRPGGEPISNDDVLEVLGLSNPSAERDVTEDKWAAVVARWEKGQVDLFAAVRMGGNGGNGE